MSKKVALCIFYIFLISSAQLFFVACNLPLTTADYVTVSTKQPLHTLTTAPPFFHYTTASRSDIYLEFDYPSSWGLGEKLGQSRINIALYEPRYITLPTPFPGDSHPPLNDFGVISVRVFPVASVQSFEQYYTEATTTTGRQHFVTTLANYQSTVDGQNTLVFEYTIDKNNPEIYSSEMFVRDIFFTANELIYQIRFVIAIQDRGNQFEQGYEHLIKSLKINP